MQEVITIPTQSDNYIYLFIHEKEGMVIDPLEVQSVLHCIRQRHIRLSVIMNTHHHFDHIAGNQQLKKATGCEIVGPDVHISGIDRVVKDGDIIRLGQKEMHVIATPGHTQTSVCYYLPGETEECDGIVWTGDTLFVGGCGRLFGNMPHVLWESLQKLVALPNDTRLYCGHDYTVENFSFALSIEPNNKMIKERLKTVKKLQQMQEPTVSSTIGEEKETNVFLRAHTQQIKQAIGMKRASDVDVFAELRRRKDSF
ncbi:MAG: hydroxyacylglutathione hydrolase [Candidatus Omnitrophica bacterium]|nr:hydroxyacylglutathione hydrolase [Candidatus Omnitrophota bacterium]